MSEIAKRSVYEVQTEGANTWYIAADSLQEAITTASAVCGILQQYRGKTKVVSAKVCLENVYIQT